MISNLEKGATRMFGNIEVHHNINGSFIVKSTGGTMYNEGIIQYMYTAFKPDLWKHPEKYV